MNIGETISGSSASPGRRGLTSRMAALHVGLQQQVIRNILPMERIYEVDVAGRIAPKIVEIGSPTELEQRSRLLARRLGSLREHRVDSALSQRRNSVVDAMPLHLIVMQPPMDWPMPILTDPGNRGELGAERAAFEPLHNITDGRIGGMVSLPGSGRNTEAAIRSGPGSGTLAVASIRNSMDSTWRARLSIIFPAIVLDSGGKRQSSGEFWRGGASQKVECHRQEANR